MKSYNEHANQLTQLETVMEDCMLSKKITNINRVVGGVNERVRLGHLFIPIILSADTDFSQLALCHALRGTVFLKVPNNLFPYQYR